MVSKNQTPEIPEDKITPEEALNMLGQMILGELPVNEADLYKIRLTYEELAERVHSRGEDDDPEREALSLLDDKLSRLRKLEQGNQNT